MQKKSLKRQKLKNIYRYANLSDVILDQKSPVHRDAGFPGWHTQTLTRLTDIAT